MNFTERLSELIKKKGLTKKQFLEEMKLGKNQINYWEKKQTIPNQSTLSAIANYFNVPVEYLTGELEQESITELAINDMIKWLQNNGYFICENNDNTFSIKKEGKSYQISKNELEQESLKIKDFAKNGFDLAMQNWGKKIFYSEISTLSEEELFLVEAFRNTTRAGKARIYQIILNVQDDEKEKSKNKSLVG